MLSKKALNRITRDIRMLQLCPLVNENIHISPDEDDITLVRAAIIGPDDTPYENGIYFYEIRFPENYPYSPPKVQFMTNDGDTRMHPNFYSCGKVCVSIIGTWSGPGWTSCQSLSSVLLTFRSLMISNPLWQEPGFDGEHSERNKNYNNLITYENVRIAMLKMVKNTPTGFEVFNEIVYQHLSKNKDKIIERCQNNKNIKGIHSSPQIYSFNKNIDYVKIIKELEVMYQKLDITNNESIKQHKLIIGHLTNEVKEQQIPYKTLLDIFNKLSESESMNFDNLLTIMEMKNIILRSPKGEIKLI